MSLLGPVVKTALPVQGSWVQSLVRELRFHMHSAAKKKKVNLSFLCFLSELTILFFLFLYFILKGSIM